MGAVAVEFAHEEITGKYEGEELESYRDRRPTPDRVKRLEKKHDELRADLKEARSDFRSDLKDVRKDVKDLSGQVSGLRADVSGQVSDLRADVSGAVGKIEGQEVVLTEMLSIVKRTAEHAADREHITVTTQLEVAKEQELAKVEVAKEQDLAKVEVAKEQELDKVDARKVKRKAIAKLVGSIFIGAYAAYEFLHRLGVL